ncbi:MAG: succinate dehydrogenase [Deltaproteobacteria bacterium]|nr:succinate dehydrogenase [Deltaproteobacteria bacterium]
MSSLSTSDSLKNTFGATQRRDSWWAHPLSVFLGLTIFGIYTTWAALKGTDYRYGNYLSPFYSPLILLDWWKWSPAILILWAPLGFRATCYYFRKAYYRAFFMDPPACAVGEIRGLRYSGETKWPFVLQNLHRFFFYLAVILAIFLWADVYEAFHFEDGIGVGVGTLVILADVTLLSFYIFSCHAFRHLIGGSLNCFSCKLKPRPRYRAWKLITYINENHGAWGWISLATVGFADLYVRLCAMGIITDWRIF